MKPKFLYLFVLIFQLIISCEISDNNSSDNNPTNTENSNANKNNNACIPSTEKCNGDDDDCDGMTDEGCDCMDGKVEYCGSDYGECAKGSKICEDGEWGECKDEIKPAEEMCDGKDNDCNNEIDDGEICPEGQECINAQCVYVNPGCSPDCGEFVEIPAGVFEMGSREDEVHRKDDEQLHTVRLTYDFEMQETEVTQDQFLYYMGYNVSQFIDCGGNCPADNVNRAEALLYCNKLSESVSLPECFECFGDCSQNTEFGCEELTCNLKEEYVRPQECSGYRLPTEAEWEYAARAGTSTVYYCGTEVSCLYDIGWYDLNSNDTTHPVAEKLSNDFGLFDMLGNVSEWVWDKYYDSYYTTELMTDPRGANTGSIWVRRGCGYDSESEHCRSAQRGSSPSFIRHNQSFRPVRSIILSD